MYEAGNEVPKDLAQAVRWHRKAADQGYSAAQSSLGSMYAFGEGVPKDAVEAAQWYRRAAEQGDAMGQFNLGGRYVDSEGVPKDFVIAYMWFNLAAAQDDSEARARRDYIERQMTPGQIAEAQRLSREWKPAR